MSGQPVKKGNWGTWATIHYTSQSSRMSCAKCVHYSSDKSCSATNQYIPEVGYNTYKMCPHFKMANNNSSYLYGKRTIRNDCIHYIAGSNKKCSIRSVESFDNFGCNGCISYQNHSNDQFQQAVTTHDYVFVTPKPQKKKQTEPKPYLPYTPRPKKKDNDITSETSTVRHDNPIVKQEVAAFAMTDCKYVEGNICTISNTPCTRGGKTCLFYKQR